MLLTKKITSRFSYISKYWKIIRQTYSYDSGASGRLIPVLTNVNP